MIDGWLEGKVQLGAIAIGGEVEMDANDAHINPQDPSKTDAIEWLRSKCNKMHLIRQALCALCRERESTKSCRGGKVKVAAAIHLKQSKVSRVVEEVGNKFHLIRQEEV